MPITDDSLLELQHAAHAIQQGGVVAYPTEAVYGLGCDPENEAAVHKLLALKQRPLHKGLILIAASMEQLLPWLDVTAQQQQQLAESWPAAITWLVPASAKVPSWVKGQHTNVAVRVTAHPLARKLCELVGKPIISTSANYSGEPPTANAAVIEQQMGKDLDALVIGQCNMGDKPSTIIDLITGNTLRR